jgi:hypothetical protein
MEAPMRRFGIGAVVVAAGIVMSASTAGAEEEAPEFRPCTVCVCDPCAAAPVEDPQLVAADALWGSGLAVFIAGYSVSVAYAFTSAHGIDRGLALLPIAGAFAVEPGARDAPYQLGLAASSFFQIAGLMLFSAGQVERADVLRRHKLAFSPVGVPQGFGMGMSGKF